MNNLHVEAYRITGCKVSATDIFSGYVLNINNEPITESIKRRLGLKGLLCELTNEGFEYDKVPVYSVPVSEVTLGDILLLSGKLTVN